MLLLATEVWGHGGIQRYMKMILRIAEAHRQPCDVLSVIDNADAPTKDVLAYFGCGGNKLRYCFEAVRFALHGKTRRVIVGHVGLLPVAWILRMVGFTEEYTLVLHGIEAWQRLNWTQRLAARGAKSVIATTNYTAREFCYFNGIDHARCMVIPLSGDIQSRQFDRSAPARELRLMTVSRLSAADRYKGFDCLLASVCRGLERGLPITLQIVGSGDDLERLQDVANSLGIQDVLRFRGSLTDAELEQVCSESHVFVMPSKKEGFGIVYLEAMATGLPCIGANHGGVPEVIEHGKSGFLVEYDDAEQIVGYLRALLESPELYGSLSRGARRRAEDLGFDAMANAWGAKVFKVLECSPGLRKASEKKDRPAIVVREP
jgi:glycosyltransferase involved in cell wall biosynthesis